MKLAVLKKMKKKQGVKLGSSEEVKSEKTTPAGSRPASGKPEPSSEDLMKAAVLKKMKKKTTKNETSTEQSKSELAPSSRPLSGRMEVFIKQKKEKQLKLPT